MDSDLEFTTQLAKETGQLLKDYFAKSGIQTAIKADHTVVTEADLAADEKIRTAIQAAYPDDHLLTEESDTLVADIDSPVWVVDPLDGTTNFSLGLPIWGVSIARLVNGSPDLGVLYFPVVGELYTARRGHGAAMNGKPLHTPKPDQRPPYSFFACCSRTQRRYDVSLRYKTRILGAAAYDFCAVARGAAIIAFQSTPKIWDLSAGWLILQ
ncbi:MAG TPA: inositol monophosphatase family protein, partial [Anaerolineales bacterium]|nr:inositol monophosphatase family protein [Anaerolineales bacterium]